MADMIAKLNEQVFEEMNSAYIYMGIAAELEHFGLLGAAAFFQKKSGEEWAHAKKFWEYISDKGGKVALKTIPAPSFGHTLTAEKATDLLKAAFDITLDHEKHITKCIHALVFAARDAKDLTTENFLQWFVKEQLEEEKEAIDFLTRIKLGGGSPSIGLFLDKSLAKMASKK